MRGDFGMWLTCLWPWWWWWFHWYVRIPKLIRLGTLNIHSFLHVSHTLIKWFFKKIFSVTFNWDLNDKKKPRYGEGALQTEGTMRWGCLSDGKGGNEQSELWTTQDYNEVGTCRLCLKKDSILIVVNCLQRWPLLSSHPYMMSLCRGTLRCLPSTGEVCFPPPWTGDGPEPRACGRSDTVGHLRLKSPHNFLLLRMLPWRH